MPLPARRVNAWSAVAGVALSSLALATVNACSATDLGTQMESGGSGSGAASGTQGETAHSACRRYKVSTGRDEVRRRFGDYLNTVNIDVTHNATPPYTTPNWTENTINPIVRPLFWLIQGVRAIAACLRAF